ncbi:MAG: SprT-like domain-containing protein [Ferruginibacter sp.]
MSKTKVDFSALNDYLPDGSFEYVISYIQEYKIQLTITRSRSSVLGDYRHAHLDKGHRISVNGDLNKFSFLITLLHEIAHLVTFIKYHNRVQPHGAEWKACFAQILTVFASKEIFPDDINAALKNSINNPAASSCADVQLLRVLKTYDKKKEDLYFVEQLPEGQHFEIKGKRIFVKGERIRKRFKCRELATGKWYLFSPVSEVKKAG